jgi:hypothetical protein
MLCDVGLEYTDCDDLAWFQSNLILISLLVFMKPKAAKKEQKDPKTTSHACNPPSGYDWLCVFSTGGSWAMSIVSSEDEVKSLAADILAFHE